MRFPSLPCTIALAIALACGTAAAEGGGVIAIGADPVGVAAAMVQAVGAERTRMVPDAVGEARAALAAGAVPVATLAKFRRVRDQVTEGWRAYLQVSVEFAASRLASARTEAESLVALPGGAELYADASLRLGAVLAHLGRSEESRAVLRLALALDPDRPITLAEFSPDIVLAIDAARAEPAVMQRVRITTTPANATIAVDGKERGRAPLEIELARGQHVVVASAPLHVALAQAVAIDDAHSVVTLGLDRDGDAAALAVGAAGTDRDTPALVEATLRYAELDDVVVVVASERRGGPTLLVQRCAGIPARCSATVDLGYPDPAGLTAAARAAWEAIRVGELRYPPSVAGTPNARPRSHRCEACRSPWLWSGVAAAAIIGTVVVVFVTTGSRSTPIVGVDPGDYTRP